jgi:hypothetical protein
MRFGAEIAGWVLDGAPRSTRSSPVPPIAPPLPDAYVELRAWCARNGHGLGAKDHNGDSRLPLHPQLQAGTLIRDIHHHHGMRAQ